MNRNVDKVMEDFLDTEEEKIRFRKHIRNNRLYRRWGISL